MSKINEMMLDTDKGSIVILVSKFEMQCSLSVQVDSKVTSVQISPDQAGHLINVFWPEYLPTFMEWKNEYENPPEKVDFPKITNPSLVGRRVLIITWPRKGETGVIVEHERSDSWVPGSRECTTTVKPDSNPNLEWLFDETDYITID